MDSEQKHAGAARVFRYHDRLKRLSGLGDRRKTFRSASADGRPQMRLPVRRLRRGVLDKSNTASGVWADTAYRRGKGNFARRLP
jgi:hypothetical protein